MCVCAVCMSECVPVGMCRWMYICFFLNHLVWVLRTRVRYALCQVGYLPVPNILLKSCPSHGIRVDTSGMGYLFCSLLKKKLCSRNPNKWRRNEETCLWRRLLLTLGTTDPYLWPGPGGLWKMFPQNPAEVQGSENAVAHPLRSEGSSLECNSLKVWHSQRAVQNQWN